MKTRNLGLWLLTAIATALVACAGGQSLPSVSKAPGAPAKSVTAHLLVKIPREARKRHRVRIGSNYVSAATTSLKFVLNAVNGGAVPSGFTTTVFINLAGCTSSSSTYTCATAWTVPAASDTFSVFACTGSNCSGSILSENVLTQTVAAGSSNVSVTLWGVPSQIVAVPQKSAYETGSSPNYTILGAATPWPFTVQVQDAAGDAIVGPGSPTVSASPANADYTASISGNTLNVTPESTNGPIPSTAIKITATFPSGGATPFPGTCEGVTQTSCSANVNIATQLPAAVVATNSLTGIDVWSPSAVALALAGQTGIGRTGTLTTGAVLTTNQSIAFDPSGNLYVGGINSGTALIAVFAASQIASAIAGNSNVTATGSLFCNAKGGSGGITAIAAGGTGDVFATELQKDSSAHLDICGWRKGTEVLQAFGGQTNVGERVDFLTSGTPKNCSIIADSNLDLFVYDDTPQISSWGSGTVTAALASGTTASADGSYATGAVSGLLSTVPRSMAIVAGSLVATGSGNQEQLNVWKAGEVPTSTTSLAAFGSLSSAGSSMGSIAFDASGNLFSFGATGTDILAYPSSAITTAVGGGTGSATGSLAGASTIDGISIDTTENSLYAAVPGSSAVDVWYGNQLTSAIGGTSSVAASGSLTTGSGVFDVLVVP